VVERRMEGSQRHWLKSRQYRLGGKHLLPIIGNWRRLPSPEPFPLCRPARAVLLPESAAMRAAPQQAPAPPVLQARTQQSEGCRCELVEMGLFYLHLDLGHALG
jgi:hypothetical protein